MSTIENILKSIDHRLASIETKVDNQQRREVLWKTSYSCGETAALTTTYGLQRYRPFTIRLACKDGRVPEAMKGENGFWRIPKDAVQRILEDGIPPERRERDPDISGIRH